MPTPITHLCFAFCFALLCKSLHQTARCALHCTASQTAYSHSWLTFRPTDIYNLQVSGQVQVGKW